MDFFWFCRIRGPALLSYNTGCINHLALSTDIHTSTHICENLHSFQTFIYPILAFLVGLVNDIRVHNAYPTYRTKSYASDVLLEDRSGLQYVVNAIYYLIVRPLFNCRLEAPE